MTQCQLKQLCKSHPYCMQHKHLIIIPLDKIPIHTRKLKLAKNKSITWGIQLTIISNDKIYHWYMATYLIPTEEKSNMKY